MAASSHSASRLSLVAGAGSLVLQYGLMRAGVRRRVDGWRRAACVVLRGEESTFVLSAFGLNAASETGERPPTAQADREARVAGRLRTFLQGQPASRVRILRSPAEDRLEPGAEPNVAIAFEPWAAGPARFRSPRNWPSPDATAQGGSVGDMVLLRVVCRVSESGVCDVWMRCNHAGIDGVPAQELLTALEGEWGLAGEVHYPTPEEFEPLSTPQECHGRMGLGEVQFFVDCSRIMAWRKEQNARLRKPITLAGAILWRLSRHERFAELHMGTTVELPASGGLERGVGVVVVRPGRLSPDDGLPLFAADFNRQVERTRERRSRGCRTLDAAARVRPALAGDLLRDVLRRKPGAFGTVALTMLKDAKVFGAPIAQTGHEDGFLAIGGVGLPCRDGRRVGCVCIKGPLETIAPYPSLVRSILER